MREQYPYFKILPLLLFFWITAGTTNAQTMLGFDLSNATVPVKEIRRGGPPPDGIPSIDKPQFTPVADIDYLEPEDTIIAFEKDGVARAYPFRILIWHEIVNDVVAGRPIAVVYCPLCGTAMVFDRCYDERTLEFGVSGLLYNSDVLEPKEWVAGIRLNGQAKAYHIEGLPKNQWVDDQVGDTSVRVHYSPKTESFQAETADGETLPVVHAFWFAWQAFYPETKLMK